MPVDLKAIAIAVVAGLGALALMSLWSRWRASATVNRIVAKIIRGTPINGSSEPPRLMPESLFIVDISDSEVSCTRPDKTVERISWDDLQSVEVVTTDQGPFSPDVFWVLHGSAGGCVIPQGATGDKQLLERLQRLPEFDNKAVIRAMTLATNNRIVCWQRPAASV